MEPDYSELGFKAGIEIHQELNTRKLFCRCYSSMKEGILVSEFKRKLRAVAGETGEIDFASAYEQLRDREFVYHGYDNESCLVELDEEPPHSVNMDAFDIALGVAKLFRMKVPDSICVMRKTVTDGSATAGFQRTMLIGIGGIDSFIQTSKGKVKIAQLNLEEDSCKIEKIEGNMVFYSLSRLGVPLLEIGTDASLKDAEHVKETAFEIGTILRSFNVRRGIGTIRQDVNISIKEGARVEIKGWQDLRKLEELVKNEVLRQQSLVQIKKELLKRGLKKFGKRQKDVTLVFRNAESKVISGIIREGGHVFSLILPKFSGLLKRELCPGKTLGKELSEYAKAYGTKGMIHSDEDLQKYNLESKFNELRTIMRATDEDLIIIIGGLRNIAEKAVMAVYERAVYCLKGVPEETRIPNHLDATSSYARPLPGSSRLYPETDIPSIRVAREKIEQIAIPELVKDRIRRYEKDYGISCDTAREIIRQGYDFESLVKKFRKIEPRFIARVLIDIPKEIKKRYNREIGIEQHIEEILEKLNSGEISRDAVFEILVEISAGRIVDYSKYMQLGDEALDSEIKRIINENKGLGLNALMGKAMERLRGRAEGRKIMEKIKKLS